MRAASTLMRATRWWPSLTISASVVGVDCTEILDCIVAMATVAIPSTSLRQDAVPTKMQSQHPLRQGRRRL